MTNVLLNNGNSTDLNKLQNLIEKIKKNSYLLIILLVNGLCMLVLCGSPAHISFTR